jgi:solute carrier family 35 protein E3
MITCYIGSFIALRVLKLEQFPYKPVKSDVYWNRVLPLSVLFCVNIILGNMSLRFVPVSFMQTVKSSVPAFSVAIQVLFMDAGFDAKTYGSVFLVVIGVAASTVTELEFEMIGFLCAVVASITTAAQAILIGKLLSGENQLDSMNLVYNMSLPSFLQLLPFCLYYEADPIWNEWELLNLSGITILMASGAIAYGLNVTSFLVVKHTSPLTYNVAGNFKIILSILFSVAIFRNKISPVNLIGCAIAIVGVWVYNNHRMSVNKTAQEVRRLQEQQAQEQKERKVDHIIEVMEQEAMNNRTVKHAD